MPSFRRWPESILLSQTTDKTKWLPGSVRDTAANGPE